MVLAVVALVVGAAAIYFLWSNKGPDCCTQSSSSPKSKSCNLNNGECKKKKLAPTHHATAEIDKEVSVSPVSISSESAKSVEQINNFQSTKSVIETLEKMKKTIPEIEQTRVTQYNESVSLAPKHPLPTPTERPTTHLNEQLMLAKKKEERSLNESQTVEKGKTQVETVQIDEEPEAPTAREISIKTDENNNQPLSPLPDTARELSEDEISTSKPPPTLANAMPSPSKLLLPTREISEIESNSVKTAREILNSVPSTRTAIEASHKEDTTKLDTPNAESGTPSKIPIPTKDEPKKESNSVKNPKSPKQSTNSKKEAPKSSPSSAVKNVSQSETKKAATEPDKGSKKDKKDKSGRQDKKKSEKDKSSKSSEKKEKKSKKEKAGNSDRKKDKKDKKSHKSSKSGDEA